MPDLDTNVRVLLEGPNVANVATVMKDGSPHVAPVWIGLEGDRLAFFSEAAVLKIRNLRRDPRIAISVLDQANPYRSAIIRGRVVEELEGEEAVAIMDRISRSYTGKDFPIRTAIVELIEPERVLFQDLDALPPDPEDG